MEGEIFVIGWELNSTGLGAGALLFVGGGLGEAGVVFLKVEVVLTVLLPFNIH